MTHTKFVLWLFLGVGAFVIFKFTDDASKVIFILGIGALIYIVLLTIVPRVARVWLAIVGALGGASIAIAISFTLIANFRGDFGLAVLAAVIAVPIGGIAGFWLVSNLTQTSPSMHNTDAPPAL
jgi:hypothetical protein